MDIRTCECCDGRPSCSTFLVSYDEGDAPTFMCSRFLGHCKKTFGPPDIVESYPEPPPGVVVETCGSCEGRAPCEIYCIWDVINKARVRVCQKFFEGMVPLYGTPNDVELIRDPASVSIGQACLAHIHNTFFGEYCTKCGGTIKDELSPGIRVHGPEDSVSLCKGCFRDVDDEVLRNNRDYEVTGSRLENGKILNVSLTISPESWMALHIQTDRTFRQYISEYNHAYKWNQKIIDGVAEKLKGLRLWRSD